MESSVLNFQSALKSLTFKTFCHNQTQQFGYDDVFANRRVIVYSIPILMGTNGMLHLKRFHNNYHDILNLGIDEIYCISSTDLLVGPFADKHSGLVKGLASISTDFVANILQYYNIDKPLALSNTHWQYIMIINDGKPEQLWHNPVKENMPLGLIKNKKYRYHGLTVEKVKEYLVNSK